METLINYHTLLIFSIFSLLTLNPVNAICVPINSTHPTHSRPRHTSPISKPVSSPETVPFPHPASNPPVSLPKTFPIPHPASNTPVSLPETVPFHQPTSNPPPKSLFPIYSSSLKAGPHSPHANPVINKICASTDYPDLCISSVTPLLKGKIDVISVVEIAIKVAIEQTKLAMSVAAKIATSPKIAADVASLINDCKDSYSDALDNFQKALDAISSRDVGTMNSMLSAAITDFSDNDDSLTGKASMPLLLEYNAKLTKMTSNCLAIVSLIQ